MRSIFKWGRGRKSRAGVVARKPLSHTVSQVKLVNIVQLGGAMDWTTGQLIRDLIQSLRMDGIQIVRGLID